MRVRDVFAIYDNNISPGLLMIIIKIIILYFIQIRHTDDFPPTGTPASIHISFGPVRAISALYRAIFAVKG